MLLGLNGADTYSVQFGPGSQITNTSATVFKARKPTAEGTCVTTTTHSPGPVCGDHGRLLLVPGCDGRRLRRDLCGAGTGVRRRDRWLCGLFGERRELPGGSRRPGCYAHVWGCVRSRRWWRGLCRIHGLLSGLRHRRGPRRHKSDDIRSFDCRLWACLRVYVGQGTRHYSRAPASHRPAALYPRLAAHLQATVRRGYFCVYTPDPRTPITWSRE